MEQVAGIHIASLFHSLVSNSVGGKANFPIKIAEQSTFFWSDTSPLELSLVEKMSYLEKLRRMMVYLEPLKILKQLLKSLASKNEAIIAERVSLIVTVLLSCFTELETGMEQGKLFQVVDR